VKLPAYGRALVDARRAGNHPERVAFVFGDDWRVPQPRLALRPEDYERGKFDLRPVAGVPVDLHQRSDEHGKFLDLAGEVARWAAEVRLHVPYPLFMGQREAEATVVDARELAWCSREWDVGSRSLRWPPWWSEEIDRLYVQRREQYRAEQLAAAARRCGCVV
jgi:hypothetical protein